MSTSHPVKEGECISSIAVEYGHFPDKVWKDPANSDLRELRGDPNLLLAGDIVEVPEKIIKEVGGAAEARHRFVRKGIPEKLRVRLLDEKDQPRDGISYRIEIEGRLLEGTTDSKGFVEIWIPPNAESGRLFIEDQEDPIPLTLGHMDPIEAISGIQKRLLNLGFDCPIHGKLDDETREALEEFQEQYKLTMTGEPTAETKEKLKEIHMS